MSFYVARMLYTAIFLNLFILSIACLEVTAFNDMAAYCIILIFCLLYIEFICISIVFDLVSISLYVKVSVMAYDSPIMEYRPQREANSIMNLYRRLYCQTHSLRRQPFRCAIECDPTQSHFLWQPLFGILLCSSISGIEYLNMHKPGIDF